MHFRLKAFRPENPLLGHYAALKKLQREGNSGRILVSEHSWRLVRHFSVAESSPALAFNFNRLLEWTDFLYFARGDYNSTISRTTEILTIAPSLY